MSAWTATKARTVLKALKRIGWTVKRQKGSHKTLERDGYDDYTWAWHDGVEIGPVVLKKTGKATGLTPDDL